MILEKQESHFANGFSTSIKYQLLIDDGRRRQFEGIGAALVGAFEDGKNRRGFTHILRQQRISPVD
jgi:hypothetical protein